MALGAKLAAPDRMMVQVVGDGSFYFGNPSSVFSVAKQYRLPILIIVLDNSGWGAVKASTLRVFPQGEAVASNELPGEPAAGRATSRRSARRSAPTARRSTNPDDPPAALDRCAKVVRGGRRRSPHARVTKL